MRGARWLSEPKSLFTAATCEQVQEMREILNHRSRKRRLERGVEWLGDWVSRFVLRPQATQPAQHPLSNRWRGWVHQYVYLPLRTGLSSQNPKACTADGRTPLMMAATAGSLECLRLLLPHSDPDHLSREGLHALFAAAEHGRTDCVRALLPVTLGVNWASAPHGHTPLIRALIRGHAESVRLLATPTSVGTPDGDGRTPLMLLFCLPTPAQQALFDCVFPLSDPTRLSPDGDSMAFLAALHGTPRIVSTLLPTTDLYTPLPRVGVPPLRLFESLLQEAHTSIHSDVWKCIETIGMAMDPKSLSLSSFPFLALQNLPALVAKVRASQERQSIEASLSSPSPQALQLNSASAQVSSWPPLPPAYEGASTSAPPRARRL